MHDNHWIKNALTLFWPHVPWASDGSVCPAGVEREGHLIQAIKGLELSPNDRNVTFQQQYIIFFSKKSNEGGGGGGVYLQNTPPPPPIAYASARVQNLWISRERGNAGQIWNLIFCLKNKKWSGNRNQFNHNYKEAGVKGQAKPAKKVKILNFYTSGIAVYGYVYAQFWRQNERFETLIVNAHRNRSPATQCYLGYAYARSLFLKAPPIWGLPTFPNPPFAGFSRAFPALETPLNQEKCSMYPPKFGIISQESKEMREKKEKNTPFLKKSPGEKSNTPLFFTILGPDFVARKVPLYRTFWQHACGHFETWVGKCSAESAAWFAHLHCACYVDPI